MDSPQTILIIGDDTNDVAVLGVDLKNADFEIIPADGGLKGWDLLVEHEQKIHAIILDRMMPELDGIAFMQKMKKELPLVSIPVIMLSPLAEKEHISEGIDAGAYFYVSKPYRIDDLLLMVNAAIENYKDYQFLRQSIDICWQKIHLVGDAVFEIATFEDIRYLSTFLANQLPNSEQAVLGISELLINAMEHGNLGITYEEKSRLLNDKRWEHEIRLRQLQHENRSKRVRVTLKKSKDYISLLIEDEGKGFDWKKYMDFDPNRVMDANGRGIAMSNMVSFDEVNYMGAGNKVECKIYLS